MTLMRLVAALAIAASPLGGSSAWAFSTENLSVNGGANSRYADPDSQVNGQGIPGPAGSTIHFGTGPSGVPAGISPYRNNFGGSNSNYPPPQPYAMPPGSGNN
jgi:hypothetical protein